MRLALMLVFFFYCITAPTTCSEINRQDACQLAHLPGSVIENIIMYLDLQHVMSVRMTCRLLLATFGLRAISLEPREYKAKNYKDWDALYQDFIPRLEKLIDPRFWISLQLSNNRVTEFMLAKNPACGFVKNLELVHCGLTMERDNFFDSKVWKNLERIDLSDNCLGLRDRDLCDSADWDSGADIWPGLCSLPKLKVLLLKNNCLHSVPQELYKATKLELLDLRDNLLRQQDLDSLRLALERTTILVGESERLKLK